MSVCNCRHCVNFEVLVRTYTWGLFNRAPVREARFCVVEPLVAQVAHMVGVNIANALSNLRARHSPIKVKHLWTNLLHNVGSWLNRKQLVVKRVAGAYNFNVVQEVRVYCWKCHAAVVHLTGENFVPEEPVAEYSTIAIWTEQTLLSCYIRQVPDHRVHAIVLFLHVVQMLSVFVNRVITEHSLKQKERIEILVVPAGRIVENSDTWVDHFVVTDK